MIESYFPSPRVRQRLCYGPLVAYLDGFATLLASQGYTTLLAREKLRRVAELSRWLAYRGIAISVLDEQTLEQFLGDPNHHPNGRGGLHACRKFLDYLRQLGCIPSPRKEIDDSQLQRLEHDYARFLACERGLKPTTVSNYVPTVHRFLEERFGASALSLDALAPRDIDRFLLRYTPGLSRGRAKLVVTVLRSFFRFLRQRGEIASALADAIPSIPDWHLAGLPRSLSAAQVERLLASCDGRTAIGQRDHAILLLLARLGLRAGEIVALTLDDVDWDNGTLLVRGKGDRQERLPLPQDVGTALAEYLRGTRPPCSSRQIFIRCRAPVWGFAGSAAIDDVVRRALARAGLDPAFKGAHLLRHSLATRMLGNGASLEEIGEILRHRHPETTQIYAKVDFNALRKLAPPWPGETR
jgi:site-specific recombinase XerD